MGIEKNKDNEFLKSCVNLLCEDAFVVYNDVHKDSQILNQKENVSYTWYIILKKKYELK